MSDPSEKVNSRERKDGGRGNPAGGDQERERWIAKLAIDLVAAQLGPDDRGELSAASYDDLFDDALRRAQRTLALMDGGAFNDGRDPEVHAYQLFEEGEILSEEDIMTRFKEFSWAGLSSKQPVMTLMKELRELFDAHLLQIAIPDDYFEDPMVSLDRFRRSLLEYIESCVEEEQIVTRFPGFVGFLEHMSRYTEQAIQDLLYGFDEPGVLYLAWLDQQAFIDWCFISESERSHRKYRPYEAFRYAANQYWLRERLVRTRSKLAPGKVPGVVRRGCRFQLFNEAWRQELDRLLTPQGKGSRTRVEPDTANPGTDS